MWWVIIIYEFLYATLDLLLFEISRILRFCYHAMSALFVFCKSWTSRNNKITLFCLKFVHHNVSSIIQKRTFFIGKRIFSRWPLLLFSFINLKIVDCTILICLVHRLQKWNSTWRWLQFIWFKKMSAIFWYVPWYQRRCDCNVRKAEVTNWKRLGRVLWRQWR